MKTQPYFPATFLSLLLLIQMSSYGQKMMKVDDSLKSNSDQFEVKRKGGGVIGKYEFGMYKIISGKEGLMKTTSSSRFMNPNSNISSKQKLSFVFVGHESDTLFVNASINNDLSMLDYDRFPAWYKGDNQIKESKDNFLALITAAADTNTWNLAMVSLSGSSVQGNHQLKGILTDGKINIEIRELYFWEDGKKPTLYPYLGYEFLLNNQSVAAIQCSLDGFQKKRFWIRKGLEKPIELILAAAAAAAVVRTDEIAMKMQ